MGLTKKLFGYHNADGGRVYKYDSGSISYYQCDICMKTTALGGFNLTTEVSSDLTAAAAARKAKFGDEDFKITNEDHAEAWLHFCDIVNASSWVPSILGAAGMEQENPWGSLDNFNSSFSLVNASQAAYLGAMTTNLMMSQTAITNYLDSGTAIYNDTSNGGIYYFNAGLGGGEIDTSGGWVYNDTTNAFILDDHTVASSIVSTPYTASKDFNFAEISMFTLNDAPYSDFTRISDITLEISNDSGSVYEKVKFLVDTDMTTGNYTYYTGKVQFDTADANLIWKLNWVNTRAVDLAFKGIAINWSFVPPAGAESLYFPDAE